MTKTTFELGKNDGAIIFREDAEVEMLLPDINFEDVLPEHLMPLMAVALIVGNNSKLQEAIDEMNSLISKNSEQKDLKIDE